MLLNNNLDKSMIFIAPVTLIIMFAGIVVSILGIFNGDSSENFEKFAKYKEFIFATFIATLIVFTIFLHLQKRVHKEVFLGFKNQ